MAKIEREADGKFKKGFGGRWVGVKNKVPRAVKDALLEIVGENIDKLRYELDKLEGREYIDALTKLLPYVVAKDIKLVNDEPEVLTVFEPTEPQHLLLD